MGLSILPLLLPLTALVGATRSKPSPLSFELEYHEENNNNNKNDNTLVRRAGISADPFYSGSGFNLQVSIGTPGQNIRLPITTYNSDTLILDSASAICQNITCGPGTAFNSNASSTYKAESTFSADYGDGTSTDGDIAGDNVVIGDHTFTDATILVGRTGNSTLSSLGLGFIDDELGDQRYANLPALPFNQQLANIIGFSLFLPPANSTATARLMLGGVDTGKFFNTLETVPISRPATGHWAVPVSNFSVWDGDVNRVLQNSSVNVLPQPNTVNSWLPTSIIRSLLNRLNATNDGGSYVYRINQVDPRTAINVVFGSTSIPIPISDFSADLNNTHRSLLLSDSTTLGINYLGLPFFRYAYTVFDYSNRQFSVARSNANPSADNVTLIAATGAANIRGIQSSTNSSDPAPGDNNNNNNGGGNGTGSSGGLSSGAKAGIGVGVAVGVLLLIALAVFFFLARRRRNSKGNPDVPETSVYGHKAELAATDNNPEMGNYNNSRPAELFGGSQQEHVELDASGSTPPQHPVDRKFHAPTSPAPQELYTTLGSPVQRKPVSSTSDEHTSRFSEGVSQE